MYEYVIVYNFKRKLLKSQQILVVILLVKLILKNYLKGWK